MKRLLVLLIPLLLIGCAQSQKLTLTVENGKVFWARSIGSGNQEEIAGGTMLSADTPGGSGIPAGNALYTGTGMLSGRDIRIKNVEEVYIEEAGTRNQGTDIDPVMKALFIPGNPFNDERKESP